MKNVIVKKDLRPYTKKELAVLYNRSVTCFNKMIAPYTEDIGEKKGWYYTVSQVDVIFKKLQPPDCFLKDEYQPPEKVIN